MALKLDLIDGAALTQSRGRVLSIDRVARVSNLSGTSGALYNALLEAGLPDDGDQHPDYTDLYVQGHDIRPEPGGKSAVVIVHYVYEPRTLYYRRGGVACQQVTTQKNRAGVFNTVNYGNAPPQVAEVSVFVNGATVIIQTAEATSTPGSVADAYANHTNSTTWNGYAAGMWLCNDVQFEELHVGTSPEVWSFVYQFTLNTPDGWDPVACVIDSQTGRPPDLDTLSAPQLAAARKIVVWYDTINFNTKFP